MDRTPFADAEIDVAVVPLEAGGRARGLLDATHAMVVAWPEARDERVHRRLRVAVGLEHDDLLPSCFRIHGDAHDDHSCRMPARCGLPVRPNVRFTTGGGNGKKIPMRRSRRK